MRLKAMSKKYEQTAAAVDKAMTGDESTTTDYIRNIIKEELSRPKSVKVKKIADGKMPHKVHDNDACYDMYAREVRRINDNLYEVKLGVALQPEDGYRIAIYPRSSISSKGWVLANSVGVGDNNYTGEYKAYFAKVGKAPFPYKVGDRVCQMEVVSYGQINFETVHTLKKTDRGDGGFGSTDKKI